MSWRVIEDRESAESFAHEIADAPYRRAYGPRFPACWGGGPLFATSGQRGLRRVIDVSGEFGANDQWDAVRRARDEALASGITINGLPIMLKRPCVRQHGYRENLGFSTRIA